MHKDNAEHVIVGKNVNSEIYQCRGSQENKVFSYKLRQVCMKIRSISLTHSWDLGYA